MIEKEYSTKALSLSNRCIRDLMWHINKASSIKPTNLERLYYDLLSLSTDDVISDFVQDKLKRLHLYFHYNSLDKN